LAAVILDLQLKPISSDVAYTAGSGISENMDIAVGISLLAHTFAKR